jgi:hypothetical protein
MFITIYPHVANHIKEIYRTTDGLTSKIQSIKYIKEQMKKWDCGCVNKLSIKSPAMTLCSVKTLLIILLELSAFSLKGNRYVQFAHYPRIQNLKSIQVLK